MAASISGFMRATMLLHSLMLVLLNGGSMGDFNRRARYGLHSLMLVLLNGGGMHASIDAISFVALADVGVTEWRAFAIRPAIGNSFCCTR